MEATTFSPINNNAKHRLPKCHSAVGKSMQISNYFSHLSILWVRNVLLLYLLLVFALRSGEVDGDVVNDNWTLDKYSTER